MFYLTWTFANKNTYSFLFHTYKVLTKLFPCGKWIQLNLIL